MTIENNTGTCQSQSRVGFLDLLERIRQLVEVESFSKKDRPQAEELCRIITEIISFPATWPVQIEKNKLPAGMVAEVYSLLRYEHLEHVIQKFNQLDYEVKYKKSYLRTALYNSAFEMAGEIAQW